MAQSERPEKSRGQWLLLGMLVLVAVLGGSFLGHAFNIEVLNPPAQAIGICPSPAFVSGFDCVQKVCTTSTDNQQVCSYQNAGYIIGQNSSRVTCNNGVCVGLP